MTETNHCDGIAPLEPPEWALRSLREIDATADLHYIGDGRWVLGSVKPNAVRRGIAGRIKARLEREGARSMGQMQLAVLAYQGFGYIAVYEASSPYWAALKAIADFRERDWRYRTCAEQTFNEAMVEAEKPMHNVLTASEQDMLDEIAYREKHSWPELFGGRKHFPQPGVMH